MAGTKPAGQQPRFLEDDRSPSGQLLHATRRRLRQTCDGAPAQPQSVEAKPPRPGMAAAVIVRERSLRVRLRPLPDSGDEVRRPGSDDDVRGLGPGVGQRHLLVLAD